MNTWENQYLDLIQEIHLIGDDRTDRTGTGTRALFGKQLDIDLTKGFPLLTTKKMAIKAIKAELLWFLEGSNDERRLAEIQYETRHLGNNTIWTDNAEASYWKPKATFDRDVGSVYGVQWRSWKTYEKTGTTLSTGDAVYLSGKPVDQIAQLIDKLKNNPTDRRMLVSAWNVADLGNMALPPCHMFFQVFVTQKRKLSLQMYQRSVDTALGLPFNIASYAMLAHMLAHVTGCTVDRLIMCLGDTHLYNDHLGDIQQQWGREPMAPPKLWLNPAVKNIDDFKMDDIQILDYESHPGIKFKMSV